MKKPRNVWKAPWSKPAFWETAPNRQQTVAVKFDQLAMLRKRLNAANPDTREWRALYDRLTELERELKLTPTTGGVGMSDTPSVDSTSLCSVCGETAYGSLVCTRCRQDAGAQP